MELLVVVWTGDAAEIVGQGLERPQMVWRRIAQNRVRKSWDCRQARRIGHVGFESLAALYG